MDAIELIKESSANVILIDGEIDKTTINANFNYVYTPPSYKIDDVRQMIEDNLNTSVRMTIYLPNLETITEKVQNTLLKFLEETKQLVIMTTTNLNNIINTIKTRSMILKVQHVEIDTQENIRTVCTKLRDNIKDINIGNLLKLCDDIVNNYTVEVFLDTLQEIYSELLESDNNLNIMIQTFELINETREALYINNIDRITLIGSMLLSLKHIHKRGELC